MPRRSSKLRGEPSGLTARARQAIDNTARSRARLDQLIACAGEIPDEPEPSPEPADNATPAAMTATSGTHVEIARPRQSEQDHPASEVDPSAWFVVIMIQEKRSSYRREFTLGPLGSWSRARTIAVLWERDYGVGTTRTCDRLPDRPASSRPA